VRLGSRSLIPRREESEMAKKSQATAPQVKVLDLLRMGGMKIPAGFATKAADVTRTRLQQKMNAGGAMQKPGARLFSQLKGPAMIAVNDPANKKALDGLLSWHKKLAAKKLSFPKVPARLGDFVPGRISGTIVPPFDFADTIPTLLANVSDPTLAASANRNGQVSASAVSSQTKGFNGGSEYARVGIFFHPMTQGTLTISASPTYSFQWSTNSLNTTFVTSSGDVGLTVYGMNEFAQILATGGDLYESWQEMDSGQINLNFGFDVQKSLSVSLSVTPSLVYLCFVEVFAHVVGMGWPGSLATAMASATVPSISYSFESLPLVMA
jgi:hypothetical protein